MTRFATRRAVLARGATLAFPVSLAGCRHDDAPTRSTPTGSGTAADGETPPWETATTEDPDEWPAYRWRHDLETGVKGLLADESADRVYVRTFERTLAFGSDGHRQWASQAVGHLLTTVADTLVIDAGELLGLHATTGETRWSVSIEKHVVFLAVAVLNGELYAVGRKVDFSSVRVDEEFSRLYRIDPASGAVTRIADLPGSPSADWAATVAGDALYLARDDGVVIAYDADATERWRTDLRTGEETPAPHFPEETDHEPVPTVENVTSEDLNIQFGGVGDGMLYVGVEGGLETVHALDTDSGDLRWETRRYHLVESVGDDRVILSGGGQSRPGYGELSEIRYAAVDPDSGTEQWSRVIERGDYNRSPGLTTGGVVYKPLNVEGDSVALLALDAATGETLDEVTFEGIGLSSPVLVYGTVVFGTKRRDSGRLWATAPLDPAG